MINQTKNWRSHERVKPRDKAGPCYEVRISDTSKLGSGLGTNAGGIGTNMRMMAWKMGQDVKTKDRLNRATHKREY